MFVNSASQRRIALYQDKPAQRDFVAAAKRLGWTHEIRAPIRILPYDPKTFDPSDFYAGVKTQAVNVLVAHMGTVPIQASRLRDWNELISWYASVWACWICGLPPPESQEQRGAVTQSEMEAADEKFWSFVDEITEVKLAAE